MRYTSRRALFTFAHHTNSQYQTAMERINPQAPELTDRNLLLEQLRAAVPEAFADGKLNLDLLQELLAEDLLDEEARRETFGLQWTGKTNARRIAMRPPKGAALRPCPGEGVNEDKTENIFIEGDNLEVLKLLRNTYAGRIKMIYIDPPYNTGNDFIYKDDFSEGIEDYLRKSGQKDGETLLVANPKTSGRYHSNWLNFMYPRLRVAKDLLCMDGVIFVSIDDNEVHNLRAVMNEIFGEENLLSCFISMVRNDFPAVPKGGVGIKRKRQKFKFVVRNINQLLPYEHRDTHGHNIEQDVGRRQVAARFFASLVSIGPEFSGKIKFFEHGTSRLLQ
jgi:adenine-specific DNA-methyltransferase